jgi:hypothetical protein
MAIMGRLQNCEDTSCHPLLIAGIFAELARERLVGELKQMKKRFYDSENLSFTSCEQRRISHAKGVYENLEETTRLSNEIVCAKRQTEKMIEKAMELDLAIFSESGNRGPEDHTFLQNRIRTTGSKIRERLCEINDDYNNMISQCKLLKENIPIILQMVNIDSNKTACLIQYADIARDPNDDSEAGRRN